MKPEELKAIKRRTKKATPGPWTVGEHHGVDFPEAVLYDIACNTNDITDEIYLKEDADFIAHARTDVPALVEEVKRLQLALALKL